MKFLHVLGIFLRGLAMGAADVVPGVSGGTIAFVTGIYPRLITSLTSFNIEALSLLGRFKLVAAWKHVDANFLLTLFAGILCSIFLVAHFVSYALEYYPVLLWSFFFGLILASAIWMISELGRPRILDILPLVLGISLVYFISTSPIASLSPSLPIIFLAGFIAISAMLLPGVSGSFLLLLVGLYATTIEAVKTVDVNYLVIFASGAALGFLIFSRVIKWLLTRFYRQTLLLLIGLLSGSLYVVWPWKLVDTEISQNLLPAAYASEVGDPMILLAAAFMMIGVVVILFFELMFEQESGEMGASAAP